MEPVRNKPIHVYQVTDCELYAAHSWQQAVELCLEDIGQDCADCIEPETKPISRDVKIYDEDTGKHRTVRNILRRDRTLGMFASTAY